MSRKKNILPLAAGILVGMAMSGPAAHAAVEYLQALPSNQMKTLADEKNVGIDVINPMHYGMMNGEAVLDHALTLKK